MRYRVAEHMASIQYFLRNGIIPLFLVWRFLDFAIAYAAAFALPYYGNFSHPSTLAKYNFPQWIKGFAQFDGIFYLRIAQDGYSQFEHAFFPLYPVLINFLTPIFTGNKLITSLFIANASFLAGLFVFRKYLLLILPAAQHKHIACIILALLLFPTSFFFGSSYTEGLFFLLVVSVFYFLYKKNYLLVAILAFLASLTRFIGVFLFIPIFISILQTSNFKFQIYKKILAILSPFLGLSLYIYYLWSTIGDPFAFFTSQTAFGAGRSTQLVLLPQVLYRYLKILVSARVDMVYFVACLELITFLFVFTILILQLRDLLHSKNKTLLGLNLFSLTNLLVPTLTGTLGSIPRYGLLSLSFFIYIGLLKSTKMKLLLCFIFFVLHVALVTLFIQGYFVS